MEKNTNYTTTSKEDSKGENSNSTSPSVPGTVNQSFSSRKSQTKYSPNPARQSTPRPRKAKTLSENDSSPQLDQSPASKSLSESVKTNSSSSKLGIQEGSSPIENSLSSQTEENKLKMGFLKKVGLMGGIGLCLLGLGAGGWIILTEVSNNQNIEEISQESRIQEEKEYEENIKTLQDLLGVNVQEAQEYENILKNFRGNSKSELELPNKGLIQKIITSTNIKANECVENGDYEEALQVLDKSITLLDNQNFSQSLIERKKKIQSQIDSRLESSDTSQYESTSDSVFSTEEDSVSPSDSPFWEENQNNLFDEELHEDEDKFSTEEEFSDFEYSSNEKDENTSNSQWNRDKKNSRRPIHYGA